MKLTEDQRDKLEALNRGLGYQCVNTAALVRHGLVETGNGRYGNWARITDKGRAFVEGKSPAKRTKA